MSAKGQVITSTFREVSVALDKAEEELINLRARLAAAEKERDGLKAALREIEAKLTKGPYQFDGWSVVADAARLMARDALKVRPALTTTPGEAL